ncbi:general odorant-binding protein 56h-like [Photinus pyralis]|nr:general odorant-binding protein 56h-like [Photinus pyralis]
MKYVIIVCSCLISMSQQITDQDANPEFFQKVVESADECVKLNNLQSDDLEDIFSDSSEISDDIKCYVKCILEKTGIMNADGEIDDVALKVSLPLTYADSKKDQIVEKCAKQTTDDLCEAAFNLAKCCEDFQ